MKRSMLRMPSKDCQAGKGYLKRTVFVQAGPKWEKKRDLLSYLTVLFGDVIEKQGFSAKS
jgi:hypothetical protein